MTELTQGAALSFRFDRESLMPLARSLAGDFTNGSPFQHVVIDDLLPDYVLDAVLAEFPEPRDVPWQEFAQATEVKLALADTEVMGPVTNHVLAQFNGQVFVEFLEALTGIDHLIPDPHYHGGGLHQIRQGGFLKVHADFNWHERLQLYRRLNAIVYLNKDWDPSYGGALELWKKDMSAAEHKVAPLFNKMVVFATNDDSYHGHPDPLTCPPDRARRSMALYYYTTARPPGGDEAAHTTLFQGRPGETIKKPAKESFKRWVPPAVADFVRTRRGT
jgi:Rps23 Pro-64 3,4-dihydroxylase Tpa1-like proline 4-hydroxylase